MKTLSILIPSNRPMGLDRFLDSFFKNTRIKDDIEIVVLVDDTIDFVEFDEKEGTRIIKIHKVPEVPLVLSKLNEVCLNAASGRWVMLGNDDCIIETPDWDDQFRQAMVFYKDELCLIYPNDGMFGQGLACFPIISKRFIELVGLFPMPYHRYKQDDTIFHIMPPVRRMFLESCKFTHMNDQGLDGFKLPDGRIYPIDRQAAEVDQQFWELEASRRIEMGRKIEEALGLGNQKVLIGIPTVEMARRAVFYDYYNMLAKPPNSIMTFAHGQSPAKNRNLIIEQALINNCSHVMFIDDDMAFDTDGLIRLLSHDKDMVTGFYVMRNHPHKPLIFDMREKDGSCRPYWPRDDEKGLIKVINAGLGFCLIKTKVFLGMKKPWITLGELTPDDWCDDIAFFNRAFDAGFELYCDLDISVGHMASLTVKPLHHNGKWHTEYDTSGEGKIVFPMVRPTVPVEVV